MLIRIITINVEHSILLMMIVACCAVVSAQERTCGMEAYMLEKMEDPLFAVEYKANQLKFRKELKKVVQNKGIAQRLNPVVIPVAVHFPEGSETNRACLEAFAQNQLDILNRDFTQTNADFSQWASASSFYPGVVPGFTNIYFCLATLNHPTNTDAQLVQGGPAVTIGWDFGNGNDEDARWAGYMNFLVKNIGASNLGYSPLGGSITAGQAVVVNTNAFASGAGCPDYTPQPTYNLGRTTTHELGHFYNLKHTFNSDGNGVCGAVGDGITDTPEVANSSYGCPSAGSRNGCISGQKALTMNYMDYVDDACMYMYTKGQTNVVEAYINMLETQFKPNVTQCTFGPDFRLTANSGPLTVCPSGGSASFNFSFATVEGFSENTVFSASGQPLGTTVSFNPVSRNTTGPFTMTVNNLESASLGDYTITVTGTSTSITNTKNVSLLLRDLPCSSVANTEYATGTMGVSFNTINNLNSGKPAGYSDYSAQSTNVNRNSSYPLTVKVNTDGDYLTRTLVWIDWNQNCSFNDEGEEYILGTAQNVTNGNTSVSPFSITVPLTAALGSTKMRVSTKFTNLPTSCENGADAEVEDYTILVQPQFGFDEFGDDNFLIYPNPNKGQFTVSLKSSSSEIIIVTVYDIRGRKIYDNIFEYTSGFNQIVNLNTIQSGMYLVNVSNGKKQTTKKIIVD